MREVRVRSVAKAWRGEEEETAGARGSGSCEDRVRIVLGIVLGRVWSAGSPVVSL